MPWWVWLAVGFALVGIEVTMVDLAFYLVFLGAAAIGVGIFEALGAGLPMWGQWLLYAVLAVVGMFLLREKLHQRLRGSARGFDNSASGTIVDVGEEVLPGLQTRIALRGTQWTATNVGTSAIAAGAKARIVESAGTVLHIVAHAVPAAATNATNAAGRETSNT